MKTMDEITDNTVEWALAHKGSGAYTFMCLAFIEDALERSNGIEIFGGDSASESAALYNASLNMDEPPRGAFVFYGCAGVYEGKHVDWGHCGLSLGGGEVIHAWNVVRVDNYLDIEKLTPAPGWSQPVFCGWVPLERVMQGHREKRYQE